MKEYLDKLRADAAMRGNTAVVFVEDFADINFWWYLFNYFVPDEKPFFPPVLRGGKDGDIATIREYIGKQDDIATCIAKDSDNTDLYGTAVPQPFLFETGVYTLENHFCYPEAISLVIRELTLSDTNIPTIQQLLRDYSAICYQVLVYLVAFERSKANTHYDDADFAELKRLFSEANLSELLKFDRKIHNPIIIIAEIKDNINAFIDAVNKLFNKYGIEKTESLEILTSRNIGPEKTVFFLPGHVVFDRFIFPLIDKLATNERLNYKNNLNSELKKKDSETAYISERTGAYFNQTKAAPETMLRNGYKQMIGNPRYPWLGQIGEQLRRDFAG